MYQNGCTCRNMVEQQPRQFSVTLHPSIPRSQNSQCHRHLHRHRVLQVSLLQLTYYNLPNTQLNCLQHIQISFSRAVVSATKSSHINPVLKSLHWLKMKQRIDYKILSLTYKVLTATQPSYLISILSYLCANPSLHSLLR